MGTSQQHYERAVRSDRVPLSVQAEISALADMIVAYRRGKLSERQFKRECQRYGVKRQHNSKFKICVTVPFARLCAYQLRQLAAVAREIGNGKVRLTKRQQVVLEGIVLELIPAVMWKLEEAGLSSRQESNLIGHTEESNHEQQRQEMAAFQCPEDCARLVGPEFELWEATHTFAQRQKGFAAVLVDVPKGKLWAGQLELLADVAELFGNLPISLTTTAALVLNRVRQEHLPCLFRLLYGPQPRQGKWRSFRPVSLRSVSAFPPQPELTETQTDSNAD